MLHVTADRVCIVYSTASASERSTTAEDRRERQMGIRGSLDGEALAAHIMEIHGAHHSLRQACIQRSDLQMNVD